MQLRATRIPYPGIVLSILCCGLVSTSGAQSSSVPPVSKEIIIKTDSLQQRDTFEDGILIITKDSVIDIPGKIISSAVLPSPGSKYYRANMLYYKMIDSLVRVISEFPLQDSAGLTYAEEWVGTPNMGLRRPNYVIIHHTATGGVNEVLKEFTAVGGREASAHYVIGKNGIVYHMLHDLLRSHHAGDSKWGNTTDLNSSSIGIELVNNGKEPYTDEQMNSLLILLERLKTQYRIPDANFIGHGDIAPTRKADPSAKFPWKDLSEKGYGLWWDDTTNVDVPMSFDYLMGLRIIGYDISYPASAVAAFKRHFLNDNSGSAMNADIRKVIYVLYRKYQ